MNDDLDRIWDEAVTLR